MNSCFYDQNYEFYRSLCSLTNWHILVRNSTKIIDIEGRVFPYLENLNDIEKLKLGKLIKYDGSKYGIYLSVILWWSRTLDNNNLWMIYYPKIDAWSNIWSKPDLPCWHKYYSNGSKIVNIYSKKYNLTILFYKISQIPALSSTI